MTAGVTVRSGQASDAESIDRWTRDTFEWGDYVADEFEGWLEDPAGDVVVAEREGAVVGVARVVMLSDREAWMHAARVHPDHRREGIGRAMHRHGAEWARSRGAVVTRLMVEDWNHAASVQVTDLGYRPVSRWMWCTKELGSRPVPGSNGGSRVPGEERLHRAPAAEADPGWMVWSSNLARAAHRLYPLGWHFRQMSRGDLDRAHERRALWQCPSGWVIADLDGGVFRVGWLAATEDDSERLLRACVDRATEMKAESMWMMVPRLTWLETAFASLGFDRHPSTIFEREL